MTLKVISYSAKSIAVQINKRVHTFANFVLRDATQSPRSVDPFSKQKLFSTGSLSPSVCPVARPEVFGAGHDALAVKWSDGEVSEYSEQYLARLVDPNRIDTQLKSQRVFWAREELQNGSLQSSLFVPYESYQQAKGYALALSNLNKYGLCFVTEVPSRESGLESVAERIGYIRNTFYGPVFDVRHVPQAKNIAYTNEYLALHMDLMYYESPPGLQLLHAVANRVRGGESFYCDSYAIMRKIAQLDPEAFEAMAQTPVTYHYEHSDHYYRYARPLVEYSTSSSKDVEIREVSYSPPFQAPFEVPVTPAFVRGLQLFEAMINARENQIRLRLEEGTCVIFDNRRVLHARNSFETEIESNSKSGPRSESKPEVSRWFRGCYLDRETFRSQLRLHWAQV